MSAQLTRSRPEESGALPTAATSTLDLLAQTWSTQLARLRTRVDLVAAEVSLAARSGAAIVVLSLALAVFALSAWLLTILLVGYGLVSVGISPALAGGTLIVAQVLAGWLAWRAIARLSVDLSLPRSRRVARGDGDR